jgi:hypothetical protein
MFRAKQAWVLLIFGAKANGFWKTHFNPCLSAK